MKTRSSCRRNVFLLFIVSNIAAVINILVMAKHSHPARFFDLMLTPAFYAALSLDGNVHQPNGWIYYPVLVIEYLLLLLAPALLASYLLRLRKQRL